MPIRFCVFVACLFLITSAFASPVGQEELQKRLTQEGDNLLLQRDMARSVQEPLPTLNTPVSPQDTFNASSAECLPIEHISFEGISKINATSIISRTSAHPNCITSMKKTITKILIVDLFYILLNNITFFQKTNGKSFISCC